MKEVLYLSVRAEVRTDLKNVWETAKEIENEAVIVLSDTPNVQVINTEILMTRFRNPKNNNNGTSH